jgi:predicted oxidoreductase (fatty acid repression mutant protein)
MGIEIKPSEAPDTAKFELKHLNATVILPVEDTAKVWRYVKDTMDIIMQTREEKAK